MCVTTGPLSDLGSGESAIEPITNPHIRDLQFADDGGFSFTAEIEVRPRYELAGIAGLNGLKDARDVIHRRDITRSAGK